MNVRGAKLVRHGQPDRQGSPPRSGHRFSWVVFWNLPIMKLRRVLTVLGIAAGAVFLLQPGSATAEGRCPPGYFPIGGGSAGWEGCAPMGGGEDEEPAPAQPQWNTRWGAVAVTDGAFGYSHSWPSERKAIKEALRQCKNDAGGATCHVRLTYHDQCVALAWGDGGNTAASAVNIATAERMALDLCSKETGNCKIYYSGCSYPERVR